MGLRAWSQDQNQTMDHLPFEHIKQGREILLNQAKAIETVGKNVPADFPLAVEMIAGCRGAVIVVGIGKAGWIGQKISASLASTGTASHFLHPSEALHGDLGRVKTDDVVLVLSNSGETAEIVNLLPRVEDLGVKTVAITATLDSTLARHAAAVLDFGKVKESGHLGLAPSASTTVMLAIGDALALTVSRFKDFQATDFAKFHPGGSLGLKLSNVTEVMRPISSCRIGLETDTVRKLFVSQGGARRRSGVVMLIGQSGELTGIFTDSDLAKLLERQQDDLFDGPAKHVMTTQPITINASERTSVAIEILAARNISELPVVDSQGRPVGLVDITDIVSL
jgi:arabinose-5-phosphate isomerase